MRITALQLENIKSYTRSTIDFTSGLNAVCGLNGSGKTTVLEAIGFALFDYLPYNQQAFLREGEKSGTIRVRLLARDGREYEVVRKIGGGSSYYVADVETGTRLAERGENVQDWIGTQALGIDDAGDLEAIFKDAVGVPQGMMTGDFLKPASPRKAVFDPLLRVQEYLDAVVELRATVSYVKDLSSVKREEIARLEGDTERIPAKKEEQADLSKQVEAGEDNLKRLTTDLADAQAQLDVLDALAEQLRVARLEADSKQVEVRSCAATLVEQEKALEAARLAHRVTQESEPGYRQALAARKRLAELEEQRSVRDALDKRISDVKATMHGLHGGIKRLDAEINAATAAADQAAALVEAVSHQDELDRALQEAQLQLRDAKQVDEQIARVRRAIGELGRARQQREDRLSETRAAQGEAERLPGVEAELQSIGEQLAAMTLLQEQAASTKKEGQELRREYDAVAEEVEHHQDLLRQVAEKEFEAADLDTLLAKEQELREERIRVGATIDYQSVAGNDLRRRRCPLLEVECPVVSADENMVDRFELRVEDLSSRVRQLDVELRALDARLTVTRAAAAALQDLQLQAAPLERSAARLQDVDTRLQRCRDQYAELSKTLSGESELKRAQSELRAELAKLKQAERLATQLAVLQEQQEQDARRLEDEQTELKRLEERKEVLGAVELAAQALEAELRELGDPRSEQQRLLALAHRKPDLEESLQREQASLREESDRLKAMVAELQSFTTLDTDLKEQRELEKQYAPDYERYLANREEASKLAEREQSVAATKRAHEAAEAAEAEARKRLEAILGRYDEEDHRRLKEHCEELGRQWAAANANHTTLLKQLDQVEEELARLRRQEEKLLACRTELDELQEIGKAVAFIRETIKAAGPAITETLLTNISQMANDIYAEIMDDHASELRWDRDYEVLVQRGAETRTFSQLSGGEQMSAALAVRLALLKEMSEVDFAFFDEPTQNMDADRRTNLADQIRAVRGFEQLIVISHDDTFEHHTDNLIRLRKEHEETEVEVG